MRWTFNAWGNKHDNYTNDKTVSGQIARCAAVKEVQCPQILEGGSFHTNGNGTFLTTEECLLHVNRGTFIDVEDSSLMLSSSGRVRTKKQMTTVLEQYLNAHKVIWLPHGVHGDDDTDGHVDNIACFISPNKVVLTMPTDCNHVQYPKSMAAKVILENSTDANGQPLEVVCLPHPTGPAMTITKEDVAYLDVGAIDQHVGAQMAGSYINFYIGNGFVVLPQFGCPEDEIAKEILQHHMTGHTVFGVNTRAILLGGGNIHCITQQEPSNISV
jgi:agmatine deiminase